MIHMMIVKVEFRRNFLHLSKVLRNFSQANTRFRAIHPRVILSLPDSVPSSEPFCNCYAGTLKAQRSTYPKLVLHFHRLSTYAAHVFICNLAPLHR